MSTTYMRSGSERQYLHRSTCSRYGLLARLLGKVTPFPRADRLDPSRLRHLAARLDLKICRTCQPLRGAR